MSSSSQGGKLARDVEIPQTCGWIDDTLGDIDAMGSAARKGHVSDVEEHAGNACCNLEYLREMNAELREVAEDYGSDADMFEGQVNRLQDALHRKDQEIVSLEEKIRRLENGQNFRQPQWQY